MPFDAYPVNVYYDTRHVGYPYGKEWKFYRPWPIELPDEGITPAYTAVWKKTFGAFEQHIDEHPEWRSNEVHCLSIES